MAAYDVRELLHVPGRLSIDPTDGDLTGTWPFGGTGLGAVKGVMLDNELKEPVAVTAEEWGGPPVEFPQPGEAWVLAAFLRGADEDAVGMLFPNTSTGATSGRTKIELGGARQAGRRMTDLAVKLVFTPDDTKNARAVCLYSAVPMQDAQEYLMQRGKEFGLPVVFKATPSPNHSNQVGEWDFVSDLAL